uniref:C2H2-type domain-containing protein n=1 Tax=Oncorhynchus mykiss TaxID=8022 RepID=A0A8K9XZU3_ONCMY
MKQDKPYICPTCGKRFTEATYVKKHQTVHTKERPFKCKLCHKSFSFLTNLTKHSGISGNHSLADMTKRMWTPARQTSHSKIMGINIGIPFAAITSSTLLGRLSTTCWNIAAGTSFHSTTK